jgi:hypothetical protein
MEYGLHSLLEMCDDGREVRNPCITAHIPVQLTGPSDGHFVDVAEDY